MYYYSYTWSSNFRYLYGFPQGSLFPKKYMTHSKHLLSVILKVTDCPFVEDKSYSDEYTQPCLLHLLPHRFLRKSVRLNNFQKMTDTTS